MSKDSEQGMKALAIIPAFNESDIIGWTVRHLVGQGLDVYVIDCDSTDDTVEVAVKAGATVEHYPVQDGRVSWRALLTRVEQVAEFMIGTYDWCMLCDADELRCGPLMEELSIAESRGYNCVEFAVYTFHPTEDGYSERLNPQKWFTRFTPDIMNERIGQQKAWVNRRPVRIAWSGGHRLKFQVGSVIEYPRVSPVKLISKHYPIRSQAQGERKVFHERRGRWADPEKDWHIQYAGIEPGHNFIRDPKDLLEWSGV